MARPTPTSTASPPTEEPTAAGGVATHAAPAAAGGVTPHAVPARDQLPALDAKTPPFPLSIDDLDKSTDIYWKTQDDLRIYQLTPAERIERLGKSPAEMTTYNEQVAHTVDHYPDMVTNAPYGSDALRSLQKEIDALNRGRVAVEDLWQAYLDTLLDRMARRYVLSGYLVEEMRGKQNLPFASSEEQLGFKRALTLLDEMEKARIQKAAATLKSKGVATAQQRDQNAQADSLNVALRAENEMLRRKLEAGPVPPPLPSNTRQSHR